MPARIFPLVAMMGLMLGCASRDTSRRDAMPDEEPIAPPSTQPTTLVGVLRGGMMAIGGETSGWTLVADGAVGGVELDVSNVMDDAKRLDGQRVSVSGRWTDKRYVERGVVRLLVVDRIAPADRADARRPKAVA